MLQRTWKCHVGVMWGWPSMAQALRCCGVEVRVGLLGRIWGFAVVWFWLLGRLGRLAGGRGLHAGGRGLWRAQREPGDDHGDRGRQHREADDLTSDEARVER